MTQALVVWPAKQNICLEKSGEICKIINNRIKMEISRSLNEMQEIIIVK